MSAHTHRCSTRGCAGRVKCDYPDGRDENGYYCTRYDNPDPVLCSDCEEDAYGPASKADHDEMEADAAYDSAKEDAA